MSTPLIVVASADRDERRQLVEALSTEGYAVIDATTCTEVVAATRRDRPDLIILSIDPHELHALDV